MVGISKPHLLSPGRLQSSCVICMRTLCRSLSVPAVSALLRKNLILSESCSFSRSGVGDKIYDFTLMIEGS